MHVFNMILITFTLCHYSHAVRYRHLEDFPIADCQSSAIDLLFVPDLSAPSPSDIDNQMLLFTRLIDTFTSANSSNKDSLRTAMIVPENRSRNSSMEVEFNFDDFSERSDIKSQPFKYQTRMVKNSYIKTAIAYLVQYYSILRPQRDFRLGSQRYAENIIVMIVYVKEYDEMSLSRNLDGARNISNLYLILVLDIARLDPEDYSELPLANYALVSNLNFHQDPGILVDLCSTCGDGWFNFTRYSGRGLVSSCYKLIYNASYIYAIAANEICQTYDALLASTESQEEVDFLNTAIRKNCDHVANGTSGSEVDFCYKEYLVLIGLQRTKNDLAKRFRWVNDLPVSVTKWASHCPKGGYVNGCGAWYFYDRNYSEPAQEERSSGWVDIGCGQKLLGLILCESPGKPQVEENGMTSIKPASVDVVTSTVARSELFYCYNSSTTPYYVSVLTRTQKENVMCYPFVNKTYDIKARREVPVKLFDCRDDTNTHIPYYYVCNHVQNCENGYDESVCGYRKCDPKVEFTCRSGQCVDKAAACDLFADCKDGSDEDDCPVCRIMLCQDGRCLPTNWLNDDETDCVTIGNNDPIEDLLYPSHIDNDCPLLCNRSSCVPRSSIGNGVVDCLGPEGPIDEAFVDFKTSSCNTSGQYDYWAPKCIYVMDRFKATIGCRNMRHLKNCQHFKCPDGYVKCPDSYCIPSHFVMNGKADCPSGEDEEMDVDDVSLTCHGNFVCIFSPLKVCLHPSLVCDGHEHCPSGEDEVGCHNSCRDGFACLQGAVTVFGYDTSKELSDLTFIPPETRYIDLSGVNLAGAFPTIPSDRIINCIDLRLSGCSISSLLVLYSMDDLRTIVRLDLSYNNIEQIYLAQDVQEDQQLPIVYKMSNLNFLNLSHNTKLFNIDSDSFGPQSSIRVLDLSYTSLSSISLALLSKLTKLTHLNLSHTLIGNLPPRMFPDSFTLQEFDIRGLDIDDVYPDTFNGLTISSKLLTDTFKLCCPQLRGDTIPPYTCLSPPDPFSSCSDLISETILRYLMWLIGLTATACNMFVLVFRLVIGRDVLKLAYGQFVTHLGTSDMLMGVYLLIVAGADTYYRDTFVWNDKEWRESLTCKIAGFLSTLSSEVSTFFIFLITVDRFLVIKYPFKQCRFSKLSIILCSLSAWLVGLTIAVTPFLPPLQRYQIYTSNSVCLGLPFTSQRLPGWEFSTFLFVFFNFFAFVVIAVGQYFIYKAMAESTSSIACLKISVRREQDYEVAKRLALVAMTNLLCWFPIGVMGMMALSGYEIPMVAYPWSAVLVLPVNAALNPLIYSMSAVKQTFVQFTHRMWRAQKHVSKVSM